MKIYRYVLSEQKEEFLLKSILEKRELKDLDRGIAKKELEKELRQNIPKLKSIIEAKTLARNRDSESIVKSVRAELRRKSGVFKKTDSHRSTDERLPHHQLVFRRIFKITGKPKRVLDLGCGLNPLYYPDKKAEYLASDIDEGVLEKVKEYFKKEGIKGKIFVYDLTDISRPLPEADVCLLFKVLDLVDTSGHKKAEQLIDHIRAKHIIASFSTVTVTGKRMKHPYRGWIERMLDRKGMKCYRFEVPNEIFYIIKKR